MNKNNGVNNNPEIEQILDVLRSSDVVELKVVDGENSIFIRREKPAPPTKAAAAVTEKDKETTLPSAPKHLVVKSPLVGTFYFSPSPDKPPYVLVGNHVSVGQKVGVIETMKIFKDVTSNVRGKIVRVLVESGQKVEYGQELFLVEPEENKNV